MTLSCLQPVILTKALAASTVALDAGVDAAGAVSETDLQLGCLPLEPGHLVSRPCQLNVQVLFLDCPFLGFGLGCNVEVLQHTILSKQWESG